MQSLIMVRGVMGRSGTNFLHDLLQLHPDTVRSPRGLPEDFLSVHGEDLVGYARRTAAWWPDKWDIHVDREEEAIVSALGEGLRSYLCRDATATVLVKSPTTRGLEHHRAVFGESAVVVLVRDPRSVIASAVQSFERLGPEHHRFEWALHEWVHGARLLLQFMDQEADGRDRWWTLARYEDLVTDPEPTLDRILRSTGLDPSRFDHAAVGELPVRGSSTYGTDGGQPQWSSPVVQSDDFDPLRRWEHWDPGKVARVQQLAGDLMVRFGYDPEPTDALPPLRAAAAEVRFRVREFARQTVGGAWGQPPHAR